MRLLLPLALAVFVCSGCGEEQTSSTPPISTDDSTAVLTAAGEQTVELSCATCIYNMPGVTGCKLAAKVGGQALLVEGSSIDLHAHGLCSGTKHAKVAGKIDSGRFVASSIKIE